MKRTLDHRHLLPLLAVATVAGCTAAADDGASTEDALGGTRGDSAVVLELDDFPRQMRQIAARRYDVAGVNLAAHRVEVRVSATELSSLRAAGFRIARARPVNTAPFAATAPDAKYQTPATLEARLHQVAGKYPDITALMSIGKSGEGRDIWAMKITKGAAGPHDPAKPVAFFNGMHHAREVMSSEIPLDTIEQLVAGYGSDPKITHYVDSDEIWVIPMLNVDGSNKVWTADSWWRKNTAGCKPGAKSCRSGTGVDINRNYPYGWASCNGSSASSSAEDYHGPSAASEPETQAMMGLVAGIRPVLSISYHSYSELVLYPYGCDGAYATAREVVENIGKHMADLLPTDDGRGRYTAGTPWETLYAVDGDDISWMMHDYGVLPYVIEVNGMDQGFQPGYSAWRDKTVQKLRPAWEYLLDQLDASGIRGVARVARAPAADAEVTVTPSGGAKEPQIRTVNPDGSFHVVVLPGSYHVEVTSAGHPTFARDVTVGAARTDLEVDF